MSNPTVINVHHLRTALDVVLGADRAVDGASQWPGGSRVALAGTLVSAGGWDYGVLVQLPEERLPGAIVDAEQLRAVLDHTDSHLDAWVTGGHLRLSSTSATWSLPLLPTNAHEFPELAPSGDDQRTLLAGTQVHRLLTPALLIDRGRPHPVTAVLDAIHVHTRNGALMSEAGPHRIAVECRLPVTADTDLLLPLRVIDAVIAAGTVTALRLTDSHALVGAGPRRATVADVELVGGAKATVWALTPDGTYPTLDHWLRPTAAPTWLHTVRRSVLAQAAAAATTTSGWTPHVAFVADHTADGLVDLVTSPDPARGTTRAALGPGITVPQDPQAWCLLTDLQAAIRLLPDGDVTVTGTGLRGGIHLTGGGVTVAIATSIPSNNRPHPRSPVTVPID